MQPRALTLSRVSAQRNGNLAANSRTRITLPTVSRKPGQPAQVVNNLS